MIEFFHDTFFTLLDKRELNYMKISTHTKESIILHPNFPFNPTPGGGYAQDIQMEIEYEEPVKHEYPLLGNHLEIMPNEVYHQKFRLKQPLDFAFIQKFVGGCLDAFASIAYHDEIFWHETGYWSSRFQSDQYMGIGLRTLENAFKTIDSDMFACCLANRDSTVIIQGDPKKNSRNPMTTISIYVTNAFLPFTEVADIFRSSIQTLGSSSSLKEEFILETAMHSRYSVDSLFSLHPKAFVMMDSYPVLAILKNPVRQASQPLSSLDLIMGSASGGFVETDFVSRKFRLRVDQWRFGDTSIFQFFFVREERFDRLLKAFSSRHVNSSIKKRTSYQFLS